MSSARKRKLEDCDQSSRSPSPSVSSLQNTSVVNSPSMFDERALEREIESNAVQVPKKEISKILNLVKKANLTFSEEGVTGVALVRDLSGYPDHKIILLSSLIQSTDIDKFPEETIKKELISVGAKIVPYKFKIDISNLSADVIMRKLLPSNIEIISSFETIGHIAHLNLRDEHQPHKYLIGQVILKKNPTISTVVSKTSNIENEFRVLPMELIAGEPDYFVSLSENKCTFEFNFEEVFWNSRLEHEHSLLVSSFSECDVICDMFAGVGPFAIPAARNKMCRVYANDLNPKSFEYLNHNISLNKVEKLVSSFSMPEILSNYWSLKFMRKRISGKANYHKKKATSSKKNHII
eukprot:TRINITY_DN6835_c0_g1_i1.p1 TRINITY_DN6835_c0_g1~~TRINITY_DN6835_c0_g1_i1.p1  ORF type:complete len:351 (+),score=71.84 TRINITY_DN6835_c0_g1_i1:35-1087(+)